MGTRNLTCVVKDGKYCIAQYCQWDGYPEGQGSIACDFIIAHLQTEEGLAAFRQRVDLLVEISEADLKALWVSVGADPHSDMVGFDICDKFNEKWPWLDRDCGAKILQTIMEQEEGLQIRRDVKFAADSLFCEWLWLINLDDKTLEVFRGFNEEPLPEGSRFKYLEEERKPDDEYYPVKLWQKIPLAEITDKTIEGLAALRTKENEEMEAATKNESLN